MKHLALRARSVYNPVPFTAPGLGDRIHCVTVAWSYSIAHKTPVTLHLTADKCVGGRFSNKLDSWNEIIAILPKGHVFIQPHDFSPETESEWLRRLKVDAELFSYSDYPGPFDKGGLDVVPYLKLIPLLGGEIEPIYTVQWDASAKSRRLTEADQERVMRAYKGHEAHTVGCHQSLKEIASLMSRAAFHVGVDSAFFHMAQLYMPWERIHLYNLPGGFESHHAKRARDNGAKINLHL